MTAETKGPEDVDTEVKRAAESFAIKRLHAAFLILVGMHATGGARENFEMRKVSLHGLDECGGFGFVVDGNYDEFGASSPSSLEEIDAGGVAVKNLQANAADVGDLVRITINNGGAHPVGSE